MQKLSRLITGIFLVFIGTGFLFADDDRYALIIGNNDYQDKSIATLTNPVNDNIIVRGSFSVDDLMEEIGASRYLPRMTTGSPGTRLCIPPWPGKPPPTVFPEAVTAPLHRRSFQT